MANRLDAPDFGCALQLSGDRGHGWITAKPVPKLPVGADKCYAPEVAFDARDTLYYLFIGLSGRGNQPMGAFLTTSNDRGRTFGTPRQILGPSNFSVRMAIDRDMGPYGRLHIVWLHANAASTGGFGPADNPILGAHSDDGGVHFSSPLRVSDEKRHRVVAPALALAPHHSLYVSYYDLGRDAVDYQGLEGPAWDGEWTLVVTSSFDGGDTLQAGRTVDSEIRPPGRVMLIFTMAPPALIADAERLCVGWTDGRYGDPDVLVRCSSDQGSGWDGPVRLNDDRVGNGISQFLPQLAMSPGGRLDAIFYDRRVVPGNFVNDVFYVFSTDGGRTFSRNHRLTRDGSNSRIGAQYANASAQGQWEFGSRLALLDTDDETLAAWTDTRNSLPFSAGQDIFGVTLHWAGRPMGPLVLGIIAASSALMMIGCSVLLTRSMWARRMIG